jgi:hypothetical protein
VPGSHLSTLRAGEAANRGSAVDRGEAFCGTDGQTDGRNECRTKKSVHVLFFLVVGD